MNVNIPKRFEDLARRRVLSTLFDLTRKFGGNERDGYFLSSVIISSMPRNYRLVSGGTGYGSLKNEDIAFLLCNYIKEDLVRKSRSLNIYGNVVYDGRAISYRTNSYRFGEIEKILEEGL